jgi:hypothetical protein
MMAYTPELCLEDSAVLRRIAWSLEMLMTKTLAKIVSLAVGKRDYHKICNKCKDKSKCNTCIFRGK